MANDVYCSWFNRRMTLYLWFVAHFCVATEFLVDRRRLLLFISWDSERESSDRDDSDGDADSSVLLVVKSLLSSYMGGTSSMTSSVHKELGTAR